MLLSTGTDLASFTEELQRETDRGLPLVAAALIDELLAASLLGFFVKDCGGAELVSGATAPLGSLSARLKICHALGLIDDYERFEIELIRKVRNRFAHERHGLTFEDASIVGLCTRFLSPLPEGDAFTKPTARFRLINATICMVLRLYHRADWVALERRQAKVWVEPDFTRWRSTKTEPPPKGEVVLALHPGQVAIAKFVGESEE